MSTKEMAIEIVETMARKNKWLCFAESCTAGGIPKVITSVPGASKMFLGGLTAYAPEALAEFLSMSLPELEEKGIVSEAIAAGLANHGLHRFRGDICIGTTGYLGPFEDGLPEHHEAWVAVVYREGTRSKHLLTEKLHLEGKREANRQAMLRAAFGLVLKTFDERATLNTESEMMDEITISRERLRGGKYTRGFENLTSEQLEGLLWLLGEWEVRAGRHGETMVNEHAHPRAHVALEALGKFRSEPLTREEVGALMRGARAKDLRSEITDLEKDKR